jgi:tetratricopeptide (TPR) repeat protein
LLEEGLAALAEEDVELRARLLARLAGALRDEHSRDRRDRMSREAVEVARRTGNPAALAYALDGRAGAIIAPDTVAECLALATEFRELCERRGDREGVANALDRRITARVMVGDVRGAEIDLAAESDIAHELRQPAQLWQVHATRAMFTLAAGGLTQAEEFVEQAFAVGERALPDTAITVYRLQQYTLCDFRGNLEEVEPAIRNLITEYPARPVFRCALAHLHTRLGRLREAKRTLDDLAESDFSSLPFDQEWLYGMSLLAETSTLLGETAPAAVMYELLAPWSAFNAADHPEGFRGSVSRYLGMLATTTSRWEKAALHFEDALATNASMGVRPWVALTQEDYARMLMERDLPGDSEKARDLLAQAVKTYKDVGMKGYAAGAAATT